MSVEYKLCGGIFFTLLLEMKKSPAGAKAYWGGVKDPVANPKVLLGLIEVVFSDYRETVNELKGDTFKGYVNEFRKCGQNGGCYLPYGQQAYIDSFNRKIEEEYPELLSNMKGFIEKYLEAGTKAEKDVRVVKMLLDILERDTSISEQDKFYANEDGILITKKELLKQNEFCLEALLLGIWHYVFVNRPDNGIGAETFDEICPPKTKGSRRTYSGDLGNGIVRDIRINYYNPIEEVPAEEAEVVAQDESLEDNTEKECIEPYFEPSSLSEDDKKLLKAFKNDYKKIMRFCINQDPTAEPTPIGLADDIYYLYKEKWMFEYLEAEDGGLRQLFYDILAIFNDYLVYLSDTYLRIMPDGERLIFRNQSWEEGCRLREDMQPNTYKIRCRIAELYGQLYPVPKKIEKEPVEVVEEQITQQTVNNPYVFNFTQNGNNNVQIGHVENYYAKKED